MLCAQKQHRKLLLETLFETFHSCCQQHNYLAARVLLSNEFLEKMLRVVVAGDHLPAVALDILPPIRSYAASCPLLVQMCLRVSIQEVRHQAELLRNSNATSTTTSTTAAAQQQREQLASFSNVLYGAAKVQYEDSALQRSQEGTASVASNPYNGLDARFLVPFFGIMPRSELKSFAIPALLRFSTHKACDETDIAMAIREALTVVHVSFPDAEPRGIGPVEFLVQLHELHLQSISSSGGSSGGMLRGAAAAAAVSPTAVRNVLTVALKLSQTLELGTPQQPAQPPLLGSKDLLKLLQHLTRSLLSSSSSNASSAGIGTGGMSPLTMDTAALCCRLRPELVGLVHYTVATLLPKLQHEEAWRSDPYLWRSALAFCEEHFFETQSFLAQLPDRVLLLALKESRTLYEKFIAVPGAPSQFAHIFASL